MATQLPNPLSAGAVSAAVMDMHPEFDLSRLEQADRLIRQAEAVPEARRAAVEQYAHIQDMVRKFVQNPDVPLDEAPVPEGADVEDDEDPAVTMRTYQAKVPAGVTLPTISTITMTSGVGSRVNLSLMYQTAQERNLIGAANGSRILNLRYGNQPMLGDWPAIRARRPKKANTKKFFFNQATMDIQLASDPDRFISCKLFENGKVQMSGNKSTSNAREVMADLVAFLEGIKHLSDNSGSITLKVVPPVAAALRLILEDPFWTPDRRWRFLLRVRTKRYGTQIQRFCVPTPMAHVRNLVYHPARLAVKPIQVEMINSDFQSGRTIDRQKLSRLIHDEYPDIRYRYDLTRYSGVILKMPCGATCEHGCATLEAKRRCAKAAVKTRSRRACHLITIICFHEGVVILTGARSYHMIWEGYQFISSLYRDKEAEIGLEVPVAPAPVQISADDLLFV